MTLQPKPSPHLEGISRVTAAFIGILVISCLAVALLAWLSLARSRAQYQKHAEITAQNLCTVLADNLVTSYQKIDLAILAVKDEVEHQLESGGIDPVRLEKVMANQSGRIPILYTMRVVSETGMVEHGNLPPGSKVSVADRSYFRRLKSDPNAGLVFSEALMGRVTNIWTIMLARRINRPDGSFGGIVYGAINLEKLSPQFAAISIGHEGAIALRDSTFSLMAYQGEHYGGKMGPSAISPKFRSMLGKGQTSGVYRSVSPLDGVDRIHAFATLNPSGHYLIIGIGMHDVLEPWRKERFQVFGFISLFLLLMGASSGMAYSAWLRQQRDAEQISAREVLLAQANQRLLELNDQKNEFLGIVAHDLRNPLAGIVLATELLEEDKGSDQIHQIVRNMRSEAQEMTTLIERFLDIAKIDSGDVKPEPEFFDLGALTQHVAKRFQAKSKQKDIAIDFRLPETSTNVYADPKFVKQALDNLVSNAMKFSPPGSVVTLRVVEESTEVIVSVEDQGPGLTEADKAKLFDRFANLSAKPTGGEKSIGLGLSIVKHLMESMAARIWVDSKPGEGASFRIALPRSQPQTSSAIAKP